MPHPKDHRTSITSSSEIKPESSESVLGRLQHLCELYLQELTTLQTKNAYNTDAISSNGEFPNLDEFLKFRAQSYNAIGYELDRLIKSIQAYNKQSFKTGKSPVVTFSANPLVNSRFYDQAVREQSFRNIEPEFHQLIVERKKQLEEIAKASILTAQAHLLSYNEKAKSTRMARALLSEGYDQNYVIKALIDKGYLMQDALKIIKAGRMEFYDEKIKSSRTITLVMGFLWGVVLVLSLMGSDAPQSNSLTPSPGFYLPGRFVGYALALFGVSLVRWIYYWLKSAQLESQ
jgi:hypothetical protein